jgi:hypothetical protein
VLKDVPAVPYLTKKPRPPILRLLYALLRSSYKTPLKSRCWFVVFWCSSICTKHFVWLLYWEDEPQLPSLNLSINGPMFLQSGISHLRGIPNQSFYWAYPHTPVKSLVLCPWKHMVFDPFLLLWVIIWFLILVMKHKHAVQHHVALMLFGSKESGLPLIGVGVVKFFKLSGFMLFMYRKM